ncbi:MAG: restriction endonuclease [Phycisphaerales bacterium]
MALWLVRAGRHGEHEEKFLEDNRVYLTWGGTFDKLDPTAVKSYDDVKSLVIKLWPTRTQRAQGHTAGQFWAFLLGMKPGDWIVTPRKQKAAIAVGEITGPPEFSATAKDPYHVGRPVKWLNTDVPRSAFDQDLLYSMGAFMTICEIKRNEAERRVRAMAKAGWKNAGLPRALPGEPGQHATENVASDDGIDLARAARDEIAAQLLRQFKGHGMQRVVAAVLEAQGYTTHVPPEGGDKGIDILAAPGSLGFGRPRICVQVKSSESPVDRPTLDQLLGTMQNVGAEQGLLVSWGGFKSSVDKELANQFFRVRLWDSDQLIEALLENYENLSEEFRAELSLKRIWVVARPDQDDE